MTVVDGTAEGRVSAYPAKAAARTEYPASSSRLLTINRGKTDRGGAMDAKSKRPKMRDGPGGNFPRVGADQ